MMKRAWMEAGYEGEVAETRQWLGNTVRLGSGFFRDALLQVPWRVDSGDWMDVCLFRCNVQEWTGTSVFPAEGTAFYVPPLRYRPGGRDGA